MGLRTSTGLEMDTVWPAKCRESEERVDFIGKRPAGGGAEKCRNRRIPRYSGPNFHQLSPGRMREAVRSEPTPPRALGAVLGPIFGFWGRFLAFPGKAEIDRFLGFGADFWHSEVPPGTEICPRMCPPGQIFVNF